MSNKTRFEKEVKGNPEMGLTLLLSPDRSMWSTVEPWGNHQVVDVIESYGSPAGKISVTWRIS